MHKILTGLGGTNLVILGVSLSQAYTVLGMVLFVLQILVLVINLIIRAIKAMQDGKLDKEEIEDLEALIAEIRSKAGK